MNYLYKKREKKIIKLEESKKVLKSQELIENIINLIISKSNDDIKIEHYKKKIEQRRGEESLIQSNLLFSFSFENKQLKEKIIVIFKLTNGTSSKKIYYKFYKDRSKEELPLYSVNILDRGMVKFLTYIMDTIEGVFFGEDEKVKKYVETFYQEIENNRFLFVINNLIRKKNLKEKEKFLKLFTKNINYSDFKEKIEKEKEFTLYYPSIRKIKDKKEMLFLKRIINKERIEQLKKLDSRRTVLLLRDLLTNVLVVNNKIIINEKELKNLEFIKYLEKKEYGDNFIIKKEMNGYLNKCSIKEF